MSSDGTSGGRQEITPLTCARRGALQLCSKLKKLVEALDTGGGGQQSRGPKLLRTVRDTLESLTTRARQAPSLAATWGAAAALVFYASKAVDLEAGLLNRVILDQGTGVLSSNLDATALGYALYLSAFIKAHNCIENRSQDTNNNTRATRLLDAVIEEYMGAASRSYSVAVNLMENLARLITLYIEPLLSELNELARQARSQETSEEEAANQLTDLVKEYCSLQDADSPSSGGEGQGGGAEA